LKNWLLADAPEFQLNLYHTNLQNGQTNGEFCDDTIKPRRCRKTVGYTISNKQQKQISVFLIDKQKVLNEQKIWNHMFCSIVVNRIHNNNDTVIMGMKEDTTPCKEQHMTATDYLLKMVHPILGEKSFDLIYPTILNKRKFVT
jgi:hypothetical protein